MNPKPFGIEHGGNVQDHHELQQLTNSAVERLELHMQLQSPPTLYPSHPAFWPRLNPLVQQRMIQGLQLQQTLDTVQSDGEHKSDFYDSVAISTVKMDEDGRQQIYSDHHNLMLSTSSYSDSSVAVAQLPSNTMVNQDEKGREGGFMPQQQQDHTSQFHYVKDNMVWWSNHYNIPDDTSSGPSISWDVTTANSFLHSDHGI